MAERERVTVEADGVTIAADRWRGDGSLIVLLHAGVADRRAWYDVAARLAGAHDVVAYDRRGFGETPFGEDAFSDVADLEVVLEALGNRPAWLVGNSMGGAVSLDGTLRFPDRVAGLVLICSAITGFPDTYEMDEQSMALEERYAEAANAGDRDEVQRAAAWLWLDGPNEPEGRVGGAPRALLQEMVAGITRPEETSGMSPDDPEAWPQLGRVNVPVVIACGEYDTFLLAPLRDAVELVPQAEFRLLPGTAHLPMLDQPDVIAELIAETVQRPALA